VRLGFRRVRLGARCVQLRVRCGYLGVRRGRFRLRRAGVSRIRLRRIRLSRSLRVLGHHPMLEARGHPQHHPRKVRGRPSDTGLMRPASQPQATSSAGMNRPRPPLPMAELAPERAPIKRNALLFAIADRVSNSAVTTRISSVPGNDATPSHGQTGAQVTTQTTPQTSEHRGGRPPYGRNISKIAYSAGFPPHRGRTKLCSFPLPRNTRGVGTALLMSALRAEIHPAC